MFPVAQSIMPQAVWSIKATKAPWGTKRGPYSSMLRLQGKMSQRPFD